MNTKNIFLIFLLSLFLCSSHQKLALFMYLQDSTVTFGTKKGFLPECSILPMKDSNSVNCTGQNTDSCFWAVFPKSDTLPDSLCGKKINIIDPGTGKIKKVTYLCGNHDSSLFVNGKPFLLAEGINKILFTIKQRQAKSIRHDSLILAIDYSTPDKVLLFCINELHKNGVKAIYVCYTEKSTRVVWSAYDNVNMRKLRSFRPKEYYSFKEVTENINEIRNSLLMLMY